jgi:PAS domain S-box-containing protein
MNAAKTREQLEAELIAYQDRLEQAASRGKAAYDAAFEDPPPGIGAHEIDAGKRIVRVNSQELRLLGYRADQMLGHVASDFVVLQDFSQRAMDKKLSGAAALTPYVRAFKKPKGACTMLLLDRCLRDMQGRIIGIRTVMTGFD